ncbi:zinc ribbon domain-containing protein [Spirosoma sp. 209]|uniref:zinc ribbon domain-containing protein n=1 Tax=Spirosoma sp. 209 TaxID=1955701 RepID=UPI00191BA374|nr:zinc ribbon domain-containing protein [Spirosoma sp. 209]
MALITCPECDKEVSDKARACPNCGFPLDSNPPSTNSISSELLQFPELPSNLSIGRQIVNWGGDAAIDGEYQSDENVVEIPSDKVKVILHTHGIRIANSMYIPIFDIHNSQVISIKQTTKSELVNMDKSVIGRAVVGGLILGPLGAVVGGMSGIGSKQKVQDKSYLVLNYWDTKTKTPQTLLINGSKAGIQLFIRRNQKEESVNQSENRQAASGQGGCLGIVLIPLGISVTYYLLT